MDSTAARTPDPVPLDVPISIDATGHRAEFDSRGLTDMPADRSWGAQTQRSLQHFPMLAKDQTLRQAALASGRVTEGQFFETIDPLALVGNGVEGA
jgi:fumarate hydratase class II